MKGDRGSRVKGKKRDRETETETETELEIMREIQIDRQRQIERKLKETASQRGRKKMLKKQAELKKRR